MLNFLNNTLRKLFITAIAIVLILCLAYFVRVQLITTAFNHYMASSNLQITRLENIDVGWNRMTIEHLSLSGGTTFKQLDLQQVHLGYKSGSIELTDLKIKHAHLHRSIEADSSSPPMTADEAINYLFAIPLTSLSIEHLQLDKYPHTAVLQWQKESQQQILTATFNNIGSTDDDIEIQATVKNSAPGKLDLHANLFYQQETVTSLQASLSPEDTKHSTISLTGKFNTAPLTTLIQKFERSPTTLKAQGVIIWHASGLVGKHQPLRDIALDITLPPHDTDRLIIDYHEDIIASTSLSNQPYRLELHWSKPITLRLPGHLNAEQVTLHGYDTTKSKPHTIITTLNHAECLITRQPLQVSDCRGKIDLQASAETAVLNNMTLAQVDLSLKATLTQLEDHIDLVIAPHKLLSIRQLYTDNIGADSITFSTTDVTSLKYQPDDQAISLDMPAASISLPSVYTSTVNSSNDAGKKQKPRQRLASKLTIEALQLRYLPDQPTLNYQLQLGSDNLNLRLNRNWLPTFAFNSYIHGDSSTLDIKGSWLSDKHMPLLDFNVGQDWSQSKGYIHANSSLDFTTRNSLASRFNNWPLDSDIQSGNFNAGLKLEWQQDISSHTAFSDTTFSGTLQQSTTQLAGFYADYAFLGLDSQLHARILDSGQLQSTESATLHLETFDAGIPLTDIHMLLDLDGDAAHYKIHDFKAHLLGGHISFSDASYRPHEVNPAIDVQVSDLQLAEALSLAAYSAVEGSGTISGQLPIVLTPDGPTIDNGLLAAAPPGGVLRYRPEVASQIETNNAAMQFVTDALSNYHYETLEAQTHYENNGDLDLNIRIRGYNPDMKAGNKESKGQQINLNLNLSDNIPDLLKSLQASRSIADLVEQKLSQ